MPLPTLRTSRRRAASPLPLLALLALVSTGCGQERAIAVNQMNEGLAAIKSGSTADAVEKLKEATKTDPSFADPPYYLGQIYDQKYSQPVEAEKYYQMALARDPKHPQFHYRLGSVLAVRGKHDDALRHFDEATGPQPTFAKAWFRKGLSQIELKRYHDAALSLMAAIKADPQLIIVKDDKGGAHYHALGDLYVRFHLYDHAEQVYTNGLKNNPGAHRLAHGLGVAYLKQKKWKEAAESFAKAATLDPSQATTHFNRMIALKEAGDHKAALEALEQFINRANAAEDSVRIAAASGLRIELQAALDKKP